MDSTLEKRVYPHPLQHPLLILQDIQHQAQQMSPKRLPLSIQNHDFTGIHFTVGSYQLIVTNSAITEILNAKMHIKPSHVPGAKPWLNGLISLRGQLLPIVDLTRYLIDKTTPQATANRIIVIDPGQSLYGLLVEKIIGIKHFDFNQQISKGPRFEGKTPDCLSGVFFADEQYLGVFDVDKLSQDPDFKNAAHP